MRASTYCSSGVRSARAEPNRGGSVGTHDARIHDVEWLPNAGRRLGEREGGPLTSSGARPTTIPGPGA